MPDRTITADGALREACAAEAVLLHGDDRSLFGVPVVYKNLYMVRGWIFNRRAT